jgi:hypothetical protein
VLPIPSPPRSDLATTFGTSGVLVGEAEGDNVGSRTSLRQTLALKSDLLTISCLCATIPDGIGILQPGLKDHARMYNSSHLKVDHWIAEVWLL